MNPTPVVAVVGPTATGKSDLGLALAEALGGEVVNADALQLYRGLDVGTAKLTPPQRRGVAHHLLDVLEVRDEASLAAYQRAARAAVAGIRERGRVAVLVGGSGLYVRAVLDQLEIPPTDTALRAALEAEAQRSGPGAMHRRLAVADPVAAAAILPGNVRRVVRALEVIELTGRPFTASLPARRYALPAVQLGLAADRVELDARITRRVDAMWAGGLVAETEALVRGGLRQGRTASRAIGYAQVLRYLAGELDGATARADTVTATRRLARRQQSWFGADPRVHWLPHDDAGLVQRAVAVLGAAVG